MKMYILILDSVPSGHAINSAAHASLACYLQFQGFENMQRWVCTSFKKVTCKVTKEELEHAKTVCSSYVTITESALDNAVMGAAFCPREEWDPFFKTLQLWN